jgi:hypothetical protein
MSNIPPRADFDVSPQVYEWFRGLETAIKEGDNSDEEAALNIMTSFFRGIEAEFDEVKNELDTINVLSGKINQLENIVSELPDNSDIELYRPTGDTLKVDTYEDRKSVV